MHEMRKNKVSVAGIDRYLDGLRREARRSARTLLLVGAGYLLALAGLCALLASATGLVVALVVTFFVLYITYVFYLAQVAAHKLVKRRAAFLAALLHRLRDELAPVEKVRVRHQVQPLDPLLHVVKSTKSSAGNLKTYYRHCWLRVRGVLADGTSFRMRLQSAAKSKRGEVLRERSAMVLVVIPPMRGYRGSLTTAVAEAGKTLPWGAGEVTMKPGRDRLVFRVVTGESAMVEHVYQALQYTVRLYRGQPPKQRAR